MVIPRRVAAFGVFLVLALALFASVNAGPPDEKLPDHAILSKLEIAMAAIRAEDWRKAAAALDDVLAIDPDVRLTVVRKSGGKNRPVEVWAHQEAERLLAALPAKGRQVYEQAFGGLAVADLKSAREQKDTGKMQRVAERYLYTAAGVEALQELATYYLDRGHYDLAALHYESLLRHRGLARWTPPQLIQAAIAFYHADQADNAEIVRRELLDRAGEGTFPLGLTRAEMQKELDRLRKAAALTEWHLFAGNAARNGRALGDTPVLVRQWRQPLARTIEVEQWLKQAQQILAERGQATLPGGAPVATVVSGRDEMGIPLVIYRSHWGIHAVDMNTGKLRWETPSFLSMDRMAHNNKMSSTLNTWVGGYLKTRPNIVFDNSTTGTCSTDGTYVYMIEDLEIPPLPPEPPPPPRRGKSKPVETFGDPMLSQAVNANKMMAFDVAVGKLRWETGGARPLGEKSEAVDLTDGHFLGAPLPIDGELYTLLEKTPPRANALMLATPTLAAVTDLREVYLAVLNARTGRGVALTPLFTHGHSMVKIPWRRGQAAHLAYSSGVLVACAHTGTIVGYDLYKKRLLWSYTYLDVRKDKRSEDEKPDSAREAGPVQFKWAFGSVAARLNPKSDDKKLGWVQGIDGDDHNQATAPPADDTPPAQRWHVTAPVLADGKVVFTTADSPTLTCLDLRSGALRWSVPRGADDLYLAGVFHGRAIVVGNGYVRAIALVDGKQAWRTPTGQPSGLGVFTETQYYLPLQSGVLNKDPEIAVLDADKGTLVAHIRSPQKEAPGNLVFFHDHLLSQTPTELVAYPLLEATLQHIDEALKKKPTDPDALSQRALLREYKGDLAGAAADLRTALKNDLAKDQREPVRTRLFEIMTQLLTKDFNKNVPDLQEYDDLCTIEMPLNISIPEQEKILAERRRRRITFLVIAAQGRDQQGKLSEALPYYLDLAALNPGELVPLPTDPALKVSLDRWALRRIEDMVKKATPEQRRQLEAEMMEYWKKAKAKNRG